MAASEASRRHWEWTLQCCEREKEKAEAEIKDARLRLEDAQKKLSKAQRGIIACNLLLQGYK